MNWNPPEGMGNAHRCSENPQSPGISSCRPMQRRSSGRPSRPPCPKKERHRYFGSLRSSQALAQSMFGNLIAAGKAALLEGLETDEGLPAFFDGVGEARLQLEYAVDHLGEPRSTSIDLWVEGSRRVAVECKFTETEFGTCSRPGLRPTDTNYARDYCNGDYLQQQGRSSRCSLTEIGVRYWRYIPEILSWDKRYRPASLPTRGHLPARSQYSRSLHYPGSTHGDGKRPCPGDL